MLCQILLRATALHSCFILPCESNEVATGSFAQPNDPTLLNEIVQYLYCNSMYRASESILCPNPNCTHITR